MAWIPCKVCNYNINTSIEWWIRKGYHVYCKECHELLFNKLKMDQSIEGLLDDLKKAIRAKDQAEKTIVNAEQKKKKAQYEYKQLMDTLRAKEFTV